MTDQTIIEIQILLEIALSIGNRLDLADMLKECIHTFLRKLDLSAGVVLRMEETESNCWTFSDIFSIPKRICQNKVYQEIRDGLPNNLHHSELGAFLDILPVIQKHEKGTYAICNLPGFGLLILIGQEERISYSLMKSLQSMNDKLANACIACTQNAKLIDEIARRESSEAMQKRLQTQLEQAKRLESIGALAGGVAHDFNNLLVPIIGMSEMLITRLDEKSREQHYVHEILKAGRRAAELARQILLFSRQRESTVSPVNIQLVLKEALTLCRSCISSNIDIEQIIQKKCRPVMANATQVHQIVMNLITNAYHAIGEKNGKISVELKELELCPDDLPGHSVTPGRYVHLSVSDTGCGMTPEIMERIFDPYFTTKEEGKGTGLGLATVYGIVKEYRGEIIVYSELAEGTTVNIFLPVIEEDTEKSLNAEAAEIQTGSEHILLVDNDPSNVETEKIMLEQLGYRITAFMDSFEALAAFQTDPNTYDLVITDMMMPLMTGDLLSKELRKISPEIPILIYTGLRERVNNETLAATGINNILYKPLSRSEFSRKIREVFNTDTQSDREESKPEDYSS